MAMTIIEQIIDELTDSNNSLAIPMLKTKVLAARIGNVQLENWTNDELSGYREKEIPSYRIAKSSATCTMKQGYQIFENQPLPISLFDKKLIDTIMQYRFYDSIHTLDAQEKENKNGTIYKEFGADFCAMMTKELSKAGQSFIIVSLRIEVHVSQITQILAEIRTKLLDFMLQLEREVPNLDDLIKNKLIMKENVNKKVEQIYNQTIISSSGFGNIITTGQGNTITSNINISRGNIEDLRRELGKYHIPEENIDEITQIVQEELPNSETNRFGDRVNNWIKKMIGKAVDGTWDIAVGVGSGLLVEIIKAYYGL